MSCWLSVFSFRSLWVCSLIALWLGVSMASEPLLAQPVDPQKNPNPPPGTTRLTTTVEVHLLTISDNAALYAQRWRTALEPYEVGVSIRRGDETVKLETTEKTRGTLRQVVAVGVLDRTGEARFADRVFKPGDAAALKEWIDELKVYGAQGTPDGQPLWGLTPAQFDRFYNDLMVVNDAPLVGEPLRKAVSLLPIAKAVSVRWSTASAEAMLTAAQAGNEPLVRQDVSGFTVATALAISLSDAGYGFRPTRTPAGTIELVIEPLDGAGELWPVGWPLKSARTTAAPGLFRQLPIEVIDQPLTDVVSAIEVEAEIPIRWNYAGLAAEQIDPAEVTINLPLKKNTWGITLRSAAFKARLTREIWQDEAGRAFVWLTPIKRSRQRDN